MSHSGWVLGACHHIPRAGQSAASVLSQPFCSKHMASSLLRDSVPVSSPKKGRSTCAHKILEKSFGQPAFLEEASLGNAWSQLCAARFVRRTWHFLRQVRFPLNKKGRRPGGNPNLPNANAISHNRLAARQHPEDPGNLGKPKESQGNQRKPSQETPRKPQVGDHQFDCRK